ncbi:hypothetical protein [Vibrio ishigakensis]|nr:hypothetical protein [Vibrio ishigakensis]
MNYSLHFEKNLSASLSRQDARLENIYSRVLDYCVRAGFISKESMRASNPRFVWLQETIRKNIMSLSLLQQIIIDCAEPALSLDEVNNDVDEKAKLIIREIAKKILDSSPDFSADCL